MHRGATGKQWGRIALRLSMVALGALALTWSLVAATSEAHPRKDPRRARPDRVVVQAAAVIPSGARRLGSVASSSSVNGAVVLKPRDDAALTSFIELVSDRSSPMFGHYLAPGAFAGRFGPAQPVIAAVRSQLQADGLRVGGVSSDGLMVRFSGSAASTEGGFHTHLERLRLPGGTTGEATTSAVSLPSDLSGAVAAVIGLDSTVREHPLGASRPATTAKLTRGTKRSFPAARAGRLADPAAGPSACPAAQADAQITGGLADDQIAHAYGAFGLYGAGDTGAGQHIALYELEPFQRSDIQTFDTCYFGAARAAGMLKHLRVIRVDGGQPRGPGSGEASLDVEDVSALAPGADIDVYVGPAPNVNPNVYDAFDEYAAIIDRDRDQVVSTSWGLCEQALQRGQPGLQEAENYLFQQAATQGQTVFSAAGDNGSDDCNTYETGTPVGGQNPLSVEDPASQPYVLGVGGTTIDDAVSQPPLEHVWNDGPHEGAGGGGISMSWEMPAWQQQSQVPGIAHPGDRVYADANLIEREAGYAPDFCQVHAAPDEARAPCRLVPDVSAQADQFTGSVTVYSASAAESSAPDGWTTTGGTSSASPIWAASLALVNASPTCTSQPATRKGVGFAAPLLYALASDPSQYAASFNDVSAGNNDLYGLENGLVFAAVRGYDLGSGLGSPRLTGPNGTAGLAYYLCRSAIQPGRPTVSGLHPNVGTSAGGEQIRISGRGFGGRGSSRVAAIQVGSVRISARHFEVRSPSSIRLTLPPARATEPPAAPAAQDGAGPAEVTVILKNGRASASGRPATFNYVDERGATARPSVGDVSPDGGLESARGTVTIIGTGFSHATQVTFGGRPAPRFRVDSSDRITATWPRYSRATICAPLPKKGVFAREDAGNDVCQVQVRVANARGVSATARIRPPLEGALVQNSLGVIVAPHACHCEVAQASDEFDYLPRPRVAAISTSFGPASLASEQGGTLVTVRGSGFDPLAIDWADFGDPALESSQDFAYVFLSGTEMQILAPPRTASTDVATTPFSVRTLAGQSASAQVHYAGVPEIGQVTNRADPVELDGLSGAPDTGRTPIALSGHGFADQVLGVKVVGVDDAEFSFGTQYTYATEGDTRLTMQTVAQNPGLVSVTPCTVTGCARKTTSDRLLLYPPGAPRVDAIAPASGPAAGGTATVITGENLGCPLRVLFGAAPATSVAPEQAALGCGSTSSLTATSPPGTPSATVPVTVQTAESYFTNAGQSATTAGFGYR